MQDMLVKTSMQKLLKYNDILLHKQQVRILSKKFNEDLFLLLYVLHYLLFIYDESFILFMLRCLMQILLSQSMEISGDNNDNNRNSNNSGVFSGLRQLGNFTGRLSTLSRNTGSEETPNSADTIIETHPETSTNQEDTGNNTLSTNGDPLDDFEQLVSSFTTEQKNGIVLKLLATFTLAWSIMIFYQLFFCLGDTFNGISYTIWGSLNENIRKSANIEGDNEDMYHWSVQKAFTYGSWALSIIGESRLRSSVLKGISILMLDFSIILLQLVEIILNYIVGLRISERIVEEDLNEIPDGNEDRTETQPEYDGRQGRTLILKLNPFKTLALVRTRSTE